MIKNLMFCFLFIGFLASCGDGIDDRPAQVQIDEYLVDKGLTAEKTTSGLNYIIEKPGTGTEFPELSDSVRVSYRGELLDGTVFDASPNITFALNRVIEGWQEGIQLLKKEGKCKLIIPPSLGYGSQAVGPIPANSVLVFDIELFDFN